MKNIIWLSPSLAAGAIAARLVAFFKRRPPSSLRRGVKIAARSCPAGFKLEREFYEPCFMQQGPGDAEKPITAAWRARPHSYPRGSSRGGPGTHPGLAPTPVPTECACHYCVEDREREN